MYTGSQWSKQEACFARATLEILAVNDTTSVTFGECIQCSKRFARTNGLGHCQSTLCLHGTMNGCKRRWLVPDACRVAQLEVSFSSEYFGGMSPFLCSS